MQSTAEQIDHEMPEPIEWLNFKKQLQAYVVRRVEPESVDDVVADIMLRLVQHKDKLDEVNNVPAWVYRVASNAITDFYRHRAVEKRAMQRLENDTEINGTEPKRETAAQELAECLIPLINKLPKTYANALFLTEIQGHTQHDAADALGISVSGMKSRVQRGRQKLKDELTKCCAVQLNERGEPVDYQPLNYHPKAQKP
ncbi:MAG: RNA polymerase sigma factor SigZ [Gammaproteobacteria bacterium]|nr:RNA polymerase sigma factor SigZ [Gammaproteobacteria bacterium]